VGNGLSKARFLTVQEVADLMRVSSMTVYRLIKAGELPSRSPPRPVGVERNIVVTVRDWLDPKHYLHDLTTPERITQAHHEVMEAVRAHFKPEFLNRVDDIIIFNPLGKEQLAKIVDLRLEDLRKLLADRKISIELTPAAKELVFTEGYDPNYGARPLKRAIQRLIQDSLALKILDGEVLHGDHVVIDVDKKQHKLTFKVAKRVGEPAAAVK